MKLFDKKDTIKIEKEDLKDAKLSSIDFLDENTKKRAFIDILGARLAMKMLFSKKIQADNVYSLYTINNVLEELDIADIYFEGVKIDVRLVFDRNEIFIPKSHFEYDLLPDLYLVLELDKGFSRAEPLGFFEPKTLNTQNQNKDFYFYEYDRLSNPKGLKDFLKTFPNKSIPKISDDDFKNAEELFLSFTDKAISQEDKLFLFQQLANSLSLREKIVEFENFELLSKEVTKNETLFNDSILDMINTPILSEKTEDSEQEEETNALIEEEPKESFEEELETEEPEISALIEEELSQPADEIEDNEQITEETLEIESGEENEIFDEANDFISELEEESNSKEEIVQEINETENDDESFKIEDEPEIEPEIKVENELENDVLDEISDLLVEFETESKEEMLDDLSEEKIEQPDEFRIGAETESNEPQNDVLNEIDGFLSELEEESIFTEEIIQPIEEMAEDKIISSVEEKIEFENDSEAEAEEILDNLFEDEIEQADKFEFEFESENINLAEEETLPSFNDLTALTTEETDNLENLSAEIAIEDTKVQRVAVPIAKIEIEEEDLKDAKLSSKDFLDENTKKRAFIDILGARLAMKMLSSKRLEINNVYSLYTIHNLLEDLDIADIYLGKIRIDVRLIFNRNEIFIPKSHFKYGLLPDLYLVLELDKDFSCAEPLGFFEPKTLNTKQENGDFYFYDYNKLSAPKLLKPFLKSFPTKNNLEISDDNFKNAEELFLSLADKQISEDDKCFLFKQLANSLSLREKIVAFENFEFLSKEASINKTLFDNGVLDIVAAQKLFEEDSLLEEEPQLTAHNSQLTETDDVLDEVGDFLTELESETNPIEENIVLSEEKPEDIKEKDNLGALTTGIAIGGAAAAGAAIAGAAIEGIVSKNNADTISAGIKLAGDVVEESAKAISEGINLVNNIIDNGAKIVPPEFDELNDSSFEIEQKGEPDNQTTDETDDFLTEFNFETENIEDSSSPLTSYSTEDNNNLLDETNDFLSEFDSTIEDLENEPSYLSSIDPNQLEPSTDYTQQITPDTEFMVSEEPDEQLLPPTEEANVDDFSILSNHDDLTELVSIQEYTEPSYLNLENELHDEPLRESPHESFTESFDEPIDKLPALETLETLNEIPNNFEDVKTKSDEDIFSLDDFDFTMLNETQETSENDVPKEIVSFDSITEIDEEPEEKTEKIEINTSLEITSSPIEEDNDVLDEVSGFLSEFEPKTKDEQEFNSSVETPSHSPEPATETPLKENLSTPVEEETDSLINDIDDFLKNMEFSDEQKELLSQSLSLDGFEEDSTTSSQPTPEPIYFQDEIIETEDQETNNNTQENDLLKVLYNGEKTDELPDMPSEAPISTPSIYKNKKMIVAASVASVVIVSFVLGGHISHNENNALNPLKTNPAPITTEGQSPTDFAQENVPNPDMNQQLPEQNATPLDQETMPRQNQQADANRDMGQAVSDAFSSEPVNASISKVAWEVPEDLAYNDSFRKYLQIAGKNLKLNLQNNLLLANEMAYSNKVIVDLNISRDGSLQSNNIVISSGSKQIDKIVLQSVKETLMYLKMPSSELSGNSISATLIINF